MKKTLSVRLLLFVAIISAVLALPSCKEYVVKPEDIQAYLDKGADLTIVLPAGSSFDLIDVEGRKLPGNEMLIPTNAPQPTPDDSSANNSGANGEKKFRNAGAFVKKAYAEGAYHCPKVCQIIIQNPL